MMQPAVVQKFRTRNSCILHFNVNFSAVINYSFLIAHTLQLSEDHLSSACHDIKLDGRPGCQMFCEITIATMERAREKKALSDRTPL